MHSVNGECKLQPKCLLRSLMFNAGKIPNLKKYFVQWNSIVAKNTFNMTARRLVPPRNFSEISKEHFY